MKKPIHIHDAKFIFRGVKADQEHDFVANVYDEFQIEVEEKYAKDVAEESERAIRTAGEFFEFGCPLSATAKIGETWAETH